MAVRLHACAGVLNVIKYQRVEAAPLDLRHVSSPLCTGPRRRPPPPGVDVENDRSKAGSAHPGVLESHDFSRGPHVPVKIEFGHSGEEAVLLRPLDGRVYLDEAPSKVVP